MVRPWASSVQHAEARDGQQRRAVPTQTARGRGAIRRPTRAQKPGAVGSAEPNVRAHAARRSSGR